MNWWQRRKAAKKSSRQRVAEARAALSVTVGEYLESKAIRADAESTADDFTRRAVTLREIRLQNHITPSIFPPQERPAP